MRYTGHKKDANHDAVVAAFKELGCSVLECHSIGIPGFPDLVVGCMNNNYMVEIKNRKTAYGRRGLNEKQKKFSGQWRGAPVLVVGSEDEVAELVNEWRGHKATVKTPDEAIQEVLRHTGER